jgi:hypothetical protein
MVALYLGSSPLASYAEVLCKTDQAKDYLPPLPRGCHKERITASGELSFGILRTAEGLGLRAWQRQVVSLYGERYQDWGSAACKHVVCLRASMAASRRCTFSAFPCSNDVDKRQVEALNVQETTPPRKPADSEPLTASEIREMQQLLFRAGYPVRVDGIFDERTKAALASWQRRAGVAKDVSASDGSLRAPRSLDAEVRPFEQKSNKGAVPQRRRRVHAMASAIKEKQHRRLRSLSSFSRAAPRGRRTYKARWEDILDPKGGRWRSSRDSLWIGGG